VEHDITLAVNGTEESLTVESRTLLVPALRDRLDYTGPNVGCESGKCGACTVLVDGDAVKACTLLAVQCDGSEVTTAAGIADAHGPGEAAGGDGEDLAPLQAAFVEEHGLQCGYCTPGILATAEDLLAEDPDPDREAIRRALTGNVCRCTGYQHVVDAVETAAAYRREDGEFDGNGEASD